ncbi:hypothetical protein GYA93_08370 [Gordonia desulfuricans]|uniref:DUF2721 domain-containing protein n=1 Tax=Gordonia desulfuricans TaxID=89051 RepID=A0A7K3LMW6_9ACTN|nr:hypothetical protein [Gordonia desulfuricans]NDK89590.1 hypothetical protein [Gordonia desulfuricans]
MDSGYALASVGFVVVVGVVAYAYLVGRDTHRLRQGAVLARDLREIARDDAVRLAAVDEFETTLYQRLFFASTVSPRLRSAAWALMATVIGAIGALVTRGDGVVLTVVHGVALVLAVLFGLAALFFVVMAAFHAATTPRVSFAESYAATASAGESAPVRDTADED